jgi:hypothetical protein
MFGQRVLQQQVVKMVAIAGVDALPACRTLAIASAVFAAGCGPDGFR